MKKRFFLCSLISLSFVAGCSNNISDCSVSSNSSSGEKTDDLSSSTSLDSENYIDGYLDSVSATAPIMVSGKSEGRNVDYVISSYPVIYNATLKNTKLSVKENLAEKFGTKYSTDGFPQAGLFIKTSLSETEDENEKAKIEKLLSKVDDATSLLVSQNVQTVADALDNSGTSEEVISRYGFNGTTLKNCQDQGSNKLSFITKDKNPDTTGFAKFSKPLAIDVQDSQLSAFYPTKDTAVKPEASTSLEYTVTSPKGAPAAVFYSDYADTEHFITGEPTVPQSAFAKGTSDFIIFDSVNGLKLSAKNSNNYKLVRMLTYGNLYLVSTGNDKNDTFDKSDYCLSYGENLLPGLVSKDLYKD